jgi:DNA-binding response OmpR family regulator
MAKKILVAEDDPSLQDIFQLLLKKRGYEVELADQSRSGFTGCDKNNGRQHKIERNGIRPQCPDTVDS